MTEDREDRPVERGVTEDRGDRPEEGGVTEDHGSGDHWEQRRALDRDSGYWESVLEAIRDVLQEQADRATRAVGRFGVRSPLADWRRAMRWQYLLPAGLILFWMGVGVRYWWVSYAGITPQPLIGIWRTTSPSHQDRGFQITQGTIRFYTGEQHPPTYTIRRVRSKRQSNGTIHTIEYEQDGAVVSVAVFLGVNGGVRLPSLNHILWFRTSQAP